MLQYDAAQMPLLSVHFRSSLSQRRLTDIMNWAGSRNFNLFTSATTAGEESWVSGQGSSQVSTWWSSPPNGKCPRIEELLDLSSTQTVLSPLRWLKALWALWLICLLLSFSPRVPVLPRLGFLRLCGVPPAAITCYCRWWMCILKPALPWKLLEALSYMAQTTTICSHKLNYPWHYVIM